MSGTVLYVDDDTANLVVLKATCQGEFDVITASSGPAGLEILKQREVAVLLVDQRMPGMSGVLGSRVTDEFRVISTSFLKLSSIT